MNLLERGLLYISVFSIASLAGIAFFAIRAVKVSPKSSGEEVFVGATVKQGTTVKECFISPPVAWVSFSPSIWHPSVNKIEWTVIGDFPFTITFGSHAPIPTSSGAVDVGAGQSSGDEVIDPSASGDYPYTVDIKGGGCANGPIPAWVHVSK
jgi:hypothetical protein